MFRVLPADVRALVWRRARFMQGREAAASVLANRARVRLQPFRVTVSRTLEIAAGKTMRLTLFETAARLQVLTAVTDRRTLRAELTAWDRVRLSLFFRVVEWELLVPGTPHERCHRQARLGRAKPAYRQGFAAPALT